MGLDAGSEGSLALNTTAATASCLSAGPGGGAQICQFGVAASTWLERTVGHPVFGTQVLFPGA